MKTHNKMLILLIISIYLISCASSPSTLVSNQTSEHTNVRNDSISNQNQPEDIDRALEIASEQAFKDIERNQRIAIVQMTAPNAAVNDFLLNELQHILVSCGYVVVDRRELDAIRAERDFQLNWEVDDNTAVSIGRFVGADVVVTGTIDGVDTLRRLRLKVLDTETAIIVGTASERFSTTIDMRPTTPVAQRPTQTTSPATQTTQQTTPPSTPQTPQTTTPTTQTPAQTTSQTSGWENWISRNASGVSSAYVLSQGSLSDKFAQLQRSVDSHGVYVLEVNANERLTHQRLTFTGAINVYIVLVGIGANRVISLQSNGTMITIPENVTFIVDRNITLQGHNGNNAPLIDVNGGRFVLMEGVTITGNQRNHGYMENNESGGGVNLRRGVFEMNGGLISRNSAKFGGGVGIERGTFIMNSGIISNNSAQIGGGVNIGLSGGSAPTFNMRNGTITGNIASIQGGGVNVRTPWGGVLNKTSGTITGSDDPNGNRVQDESGITARQGHAVSVNNVSGFSYRSVSKRRETTSGPSNNLNSGNNNGWD